MLGVMIRSYSFVSSFAFDAGFFLFVCFCCVTDIVHIEHTEYRNAMVS